MSTTDWLIAAAALFIWGTVMYHTSPTALDWVDEWQKRRREKKVIRRYLREEKRHEH